MVFKNRPNERRRVDPETQRNRDREAAQLRREGVPFRVIASQLNMSLGAVQKALRRAQKLPAVGGLGRGRARPIYLKKTPAIASKTRRKRLKHNENRRINFIPRQQD
jgi:hypothetical protein